MEVQKSVRLRGEGGRWSKIEFEMSRVLQNGELRSGITTVQGDETTSTLSYYLGFRTSPVKSFHLFLLTGPTLYFRVLVI